MTQERKESEFNVNFTLHFKTFLHEIHLYYVFCKNMTYIRVPPVCKKTQALFHKFILSLGLSFNFPL
jgi:hypothetical protein